MELSKRLHAVASLVTEGASVADIGTDQGYIPIYLIEKGISPRAIAMDINRGPLKRAKIHIRERGMEEVIETRLSDGLSALLPGETDTMIAAGMGGGLVIRILDGNPEVTQSLKEFILQPQSEIRKVREYLSRNGYLTVAEDMVEEDGKFYPMMKVVHGKESVHDEAELLYGRKLLEARHPVLYRYLMREKGMKQKIREGLLTQGGSRSRQRLMELEEELALTELALERYRI